MEGTFENRGLPRFFVDSVFLYFYPRHLSNDNHSIFWKKSGRYFICKIFKLNSFAVINRKYITAIFDILITLKVNIITRQMTPFLIYSQVYMLVCFLFAFRNLQNSISGVLHLHYVLVCKISIYMSMMLLWGPLTWISFSNIKLANFWYITCFVPNLIPIWF